MLPKLTFRVMPGGRIGSLLLDAAERRMEVRFVVSVA